jgi:hypothetical protein
LNAAAAESMSNGVTVQPSASVALESTSLSIVVNGEN